MKLLDYSLGLILPKVSAYVKTFKAKCGDISNKFMYLRIDYEKLIQRPFGLGLKT